MKKLKVIIVAVVSVFLIISCSKTEKKEEMNDTSSTSKNYAWENMLSDYSIVIDNVELKMCESLDELSKKGVEFSYERTYEDMGEDYYDFGIINAKTSNDSIFQMLYKDQTIHSFTIEQENVKGDFLFNNELRFGSSVEDMIALLGTPMAGRYLSDEAEFAYISIDSGFMNFVFKDDKLIKLSYGDNRENKDVRTGAGTCDLSLDYMRADFTPIDMVNKTGDVKDIWINDMNITNGITEEDVLKYGWEKVDTEGYFKHQKDDVYILLHVNNGISFGDQVNLMVNGETIINKNITEVHLGKPLYFILPYPDLVKAYYYSNDNGIYVFPIKDNDNLKLQLKVDVKGNIVSGSVHKGDYDGYLADDLLARHYS